ncbi:PREDICTED: COMM domain-containing protein 1 [Myotis davidii]|uniref:COMM domain-containing protein 1 n=1 Tax=Myotis davidii TaxID=225400 RepID=UPI0007676007|nr:PREDICTED: COMM domain-containing protein 1 [Myotis davidii]
MGFAEQSWPLPSRAPPRTWLPKPPIAPAPTEELLRSQLYPEVPPEEFRPFLAKMRGILKSVASADMDFNQLEAFLTAQTKKQGGITSDQAAVISKFWKSHKTKIRESLMNQSRWDSGLRGLSWRVDGKSQSRHSAQIHTPVAIMELEIGKSGQPPLPPPSQEPLVGCAAPGLAAWRGPDLPTAIPVIDPGVRVEVGTLPGATAASIYLLDTCGGLQSMQTGVHLPAMYERKYSAAKSSTERKKEKVLATVIEPEWWYLSGKILENV